MICRVINSFGLSALAKTTMLLGVVFFLSLFAEVALAQKRFSRTYPAGQDVKLELLNRTGTVVVEGWNRPEIQITATMEAPSADVRPQSLSGVILINLVRDNQGRDVGNVNFTIRVPYNSNVNIETLIGNLSVSNIRGAFVRAHISSEGDITLTNIRAIGVSAENNIGNIFFEGEIQTGGNYRFSSMRGDIGLNIPFTSSFKLVATAPSTRNIQLGSFANSNLGFMGDGRRVVGRHGDGSAMITVTNQRGGIKLIGR